MARPWPRASAAWLVLLALPLALPLALTAGCTRGKSPASAGSTTHPTQALSFVGCGAARTAANVPVRIEVSKGTASCATARLIERAYARAIRLGLAPGNGGGGPVTVRGWTCQGYNTPIVLQTGKASRCVRGSSEILEVLGPASGLSGTAQHRAGPPARLGHGGITGQGDLVVGEGSVRSAESQRVRQ
jgi:hypothetical protein